MFSLRDHYGTQCSDGGERLQVNVQSTTGDYTLAEVMSVFIFKKPISCNYMKFYMLLNNDPPVETIFRGMSLHVCITLIVFFM